MIWFPHPPVCVIDWAKPGKVLKRGPPEWREEYTDWEFSPKPLWMRWKTYNRLDEKA